MDKHPQSWVTLTSFPSTLVWWKSITMNKNNVSINFKEFLKLPGCCEVISVWISMGCIKLLFQGLVSLRLTHLSMLKQQTQYWLTEMCWKIYWYFLLSTVIKPLLFGFSHLCPLYCCYFSVFQPLPPTASPQQFGTLGCSSGLLPAASPASKVRTGNMQVQGLKIEESFSSVTPLPPLWSTQHKVPTYL